MSSFVAYVTLSVKADSKAKAAEALVDAVDSPPPTPRITVDSPPSTPIKPLKGQQETSLPQHLDIIRRTLSELDSEEMQHALDHLPPRMLERLLASYFSCQGDTSADLELSELLEMAPGLTDQMHSLLHDIFPNMHRLHEEGEDYAASDPAEILHLSEQLASSRPFQALPLQSLDC